MRSEKQWDVEVAIEVVSETSKHNTPSEDQTMNSNNVKRPVLTRILAGTVFLGSLAFAAQVEAQQQGTTGQARPERVEGRGGRGGRGGDPAQMVERRVERLTTDLKLSTSQATAIRQILLDEQTQMEALRPEGLRGPGGRGRNPGDSTARGERRQRPDSAARAQRRQRPDSATMAARRAEMEATREQMNALRTRTDARIAAVLTSEQRTAYQQLVAKRADRPEGGPGRGGRGGPGARGGKVAPPPAK